MTNKKLLSRGYEKIIHETFRLEQSDFFNYFSNIIDENYSKNKDIIQSLEFAINKWIEWYKTKIDYTPTWYDDKEGNKVLIDPESMEIPLLPEFGIRKHIKKSFFDEQLKIVNVLKGNIVLKERLIKYEETLPDSLKEKLPPLFEGFDYDDIKERFEYVKNETKKLNSKSLIENEFKSNKDIFSSIVKRLTLIDGCKFSLKVPLGLTLNVEWYDKDTGKLTRDYIDSLGKLYSNYESQIFDLDVDQIKIHYQKIISLEKKHLDAFNLLEEFAPNHISYFFDKFYEMYPQFPLIDFFLELNKIFNIPNIKVSTLEALKEDYVIGRNINIKEFSLLYFLRLFEMNLKFITDIKALIIVSINSDQKENNTKKKIGFNRTLTNSQIENLYFSLKPNYIDTNTSLNDFQAVFNEQILQTPIKWIATPTRNKKYTDKKCLAYLFIALEKSSLINKWENFKDLFEMIEKRFVDKENNPIKLTYSNLPNEKNPSERANDIDTFISNILE